MLEREKRIEAKATRCKQMHRVDRPMCTHFAR